MRSETIGSTVADKVKRVCSGSSQFPNGIDMTNRLNIAAGIVCVIAGLFLSTAKATTVIAPTFEEMADRADLVFVGKVVGSRAEWRSVGTDRVIFTLVEFETAEVLKGNAGVTVTLQFLGGDCGGVSRQVRPAQRRQKRP